MFYANFPLAPIDTGCIIVCRFFRRVGAAGLTQRFTRREVGRILGVDARRLRYWERLRLVSPRARWGERFYSFGDLVALRAVKRLTDNRIPARRVRRAVSLLQQQFDASAVPLQELRLLEHGRDVLVVPPGAARPFNPIRRQWAFPFCMSGSSAPPRALASRTPEEFFEAALDCEKNPAMLPQAIDCYREVLNLAPDWIEAHINLGVALYQAGQVEEARVSFQNAVALDPQSGISRYNLGCVLEEQGDLDAAVDHLRRAASAMPAHPDVHFNLALAHEKRGERRLAREQWTLYLRYAPDGPWAKEARARLRQYVSRRKPSAPIPFPRKA
jgi:tetratricopeptide (TPR) repeat protein